jgi:hypothetical protein
LDKRLGSYTVVLDVRLHFEPSIFTAILIHAVSSIHPQKLKRIFEPKKEAVTRGWRKWRSEELHNLYSWGEAARTI